MNQFEIIEFYLDLVRRAQERGIRCAITSGMACVAYEVAEATKDCDLLCDPEMDEQFLALLAESPLGDSPLPVSRLEEYLPDMSANYRILIPGLS